MTIGGLLMMVVSITTITIFFFYSLYLAITKKGKLQSTIEEPPNIEE